MISKNLAEAFASRVAVEEFTFDSSVGGQQVVVFDTSAIKVTGSHPYAVTKNRAVTAAAALICGHGSLTAACHDALCRPPTSGGTGGSTPTRTGKGFGGLSALRDHRVAPKAKFSLPPTEQQMDAAGIDSSLLSKNRQKAFVKTFFEFDLPEGHKSVVTRVDLSEGKATVVGKIVDKYGSSRGNWEREITNSTDWYDVAKTEPSPHGSDHQNLKMTEGYKVDHTSFEMNDSKQGSGIGSAFIAASVARYKEMGIDHVTVYAGDSVGGYAWAREGFRIEDGTKDRSPFNSSGTDWMSRHGQIDKLADTASRKMDDLEAKGIMSMYDLKIARRDLATLRTASGAGEDVQPIHIASIGENGGHFKAQASSGDYYDSWAGKEMLLGATWQGAYYFDSNTAITAAAGLICEHGSLTAACHSAACRPPGSGGTGGSSPKGSVAPSPTGVHNRTAFTAEISMMIRSHEHLKSLSATQIEANIQSITNALNERQRSREARGSIYNNTTTSGDAYGWKRDDLERYNKHLELRDNISTAIYKLDKMARDKTFVPETDAERLVYDALQTHLARADLKEQTVVSFDGGTFLFHGYTRPIITVPPVTVDEETEKAVRLVGQRINEEINERMKSFDSVESENQYLIHSSSITSIVREYFPLATHNDWAIISMGDESYVQTLGNGSTGNAEMGKLRYDHPMKVALKAYVEGKNLAPTIDLQVARDRDTHFQKTALEVMSEVRSMDGTFKNTPKKVKPKPGTFKGFSTHDQVVKGAQFYPTDWIDKSNESPRPVAFKQTKSRAHYQHAINKDGNAIITLDGSPSTTVHEMAHRMERVVPGVLELESVFYSRRTQGERLKHLGKGYGAKELTREDQFYDPYVGKTYGDQAYEVLSMGTQQLLSHRTWTKVDPEYQSFVLGTLATASWKEVS